MNDPDNETRKRAARLGALFAVFGFLGGCRDLPKKPKPKAELTDFDRLRKERARKKRARKHAERMLREPLKER